VYYLEKETGRTSWTHPFAKKSGASQRGGASNGGGGGLRDKFSEWRDGNQQSDGERIAHDDRFRDDPRAATGRPDSHQCCAVFSCLVMPPLGVCALFHSVKVGEAWREGRYGDAMDHSRQSYNYAWFGVLIAIVVFLYFWLRDGDWDLDFDEWLDFD